LEQLDDALDGVVGFVEGRFEFAVWPWRCGGLMMKEAEQKVLSQRRQL